MKILVVEDDLITLKLLEYALTKEGYIVSPHSDFKSAIKILEEFKPDLIITDIIMPSTSGFEIISLIKSGGKGIPILVISAIDEESTVYEALSLGADDFIVKPFELEEILQRIKLLLNEKKNKSKADER